MTDKKLVLDKELARPIFGEGAQTQDDLMARFDAAAKWCAGQQERTAEEPASAEEPAAPSSPLTH